MVVLGRFWRGSGTEEGRGYRGCHFRGHGQGHCKIIGSELKANWCDLKPVEINCVGTGYVRNVGTPAFNDHLDHGFIVL